VLIIVPSKLKNNIVKPVVKKVLCVRNRCDMISHLAPIWIILHLSM